MGASNYHRERRKLYPVNYSSNSTKMKSTGEQRDVNNQVEIEPNRKRPRLDLDRKKPRLDLDCKKKINEKKFHSAPVSLMSINAHHQWKYGSTQPGRANMISSRKDLPCL